MKVRQPIDVISKNKVISLVRVFIQYINSQANIIIVICASSLFLASCGYIFNWIKYNPDELLQISKTQLLNPHNYDYLINPKYDICYKISNPKPKNKLEVELIAFVISHVNKSQVRLAIRQTWANISHFPNLRVVFMLGTVQSANDTIKKSIQNEVAMYNDIVQEDFIESYKNLTIKTFMGMKWVSQYCSHAKFVLKVDDDVIVNTKQLLDYLRNLDKNQHANTFICSKKDPTPVIRNTSSKWYVSRSEYKLDFYPVYCSGMAYIMTVNFARSLFNASQYMQQLFLEDTTVGIIGSRLKARFVQQKPKYYIGHTERDHMKYLIENKTLNNYYFIAFSNVKDLKTAWFLISMQNKSTTN